MRLEDHSCRTAREIFARAHKIDDTQARDEFLDRACGGDSDLREEVEGLLAAHAELDSGLLDRAVDRFGPLQSLTLKPGELLTSAAALPFPRIERFKLREQIGEGGMGIVYVADQLEPVRRTVAVKVVKPGMDTREVVGRFEAERQALALMDHPHIARVLDAGTTAEGRPFFVMELVNGIPITDYCDQAQLGTRARLKLFLKVCQAVEHAHQKGVIHRDLKPGNVLVTLHDGTAVPKVIDFGVAKALKQRLTEHTIYTQFRQIIGTPAYMSPEQAALSGLDVDTRSDVYSLGVLLYELLTGTTPFSKEELTSKGFDEMRRIIREKEPLRPSERVTTLGGSARTSFEQSRGVEAGDLGRALRRELDWIVMRALEKDRGRRYESATALAADVRRYLDHEPIDAKPPTVLDRAERWCRRNRPIVWLTTSLVLVSTILSVMAAGLVLRAYRSEQVARKIAEDDRDAAEASRITAQEAQRREAASRTREAAANRIARRHLIQSLLQLAGTHFEQGEIGLGLVQLARTLEQTGPGTEDLERACRMNLAAWQSYLRNVRLIAKHADNVWCVAFSPDGNTIATSSEDKTVMLWSAETGEALTRPIRHDGSVWCVDFSPDGLAIVTGSHDKTARQWDVATGAPLGPPMRHNGTIRVVRFSPDGQTILTASDDATVRLWDRSSGEPIGPSLHHGSGVFSAAFNPDGTTILTGGSEGQIQRWDATTRMPLGPPAKHKACVRDVEYCADGRIFLTGSEDCTARLWDAVTQTPIGQPMEHEGQVWGVAVSPDGTTVCTNCADGTFRLWDAASGKPLSFPVQCQSLGQCATFTRDGQSVVVDRPGGQENQKTLYVCDVQALTLGDHILSHQAEIYAGQFSSDGETIATGGSDGTVRLWDSETGESVGAPLEHSGAVYALAFAPDGDALLSGGSSRTAQLWNLTTGQPSGPPLQAQGIVDAVAFHPDGNLVLVGDRDGFVQIWDRHAGEAIVHVLQHNWMVYEAVFSPNGRYVLTACQDGLVRQWDTTTGELIGEPIDHRGAITGLAVSCDGATVCSGGIDATARRWNIPTGNQVGRPLKHKGTVFEVAISPDGKALLTGSEDSTARMWDAATDEPIGPPLQHQGPVKDVAFSPDGTSCLTTSADGTARLWDVPTPVEGDPEDITLRIQVITGMELDGNGDFRYLSASTWRERRRRLLEEQRGAEAFGSPE